jgi:hypothetical protein
VRYAFGEATNETEGGQEEVGVKLLTTVWRIQAFN